jgi:HSP20 family protein
MLNTLYTNDVRQTLDQFRRSVDQMFENFYGWERPSSGNPSAAERNWTFSPVLESGWNEHQLMLRAILPGVSDKDVNVTIQNNQLVLECERKALEGFNKNAYTQLAYGKFFTAVTLPSGLDTDHISCRLHQGILEIVIPVSETARPKQIQIQTAGTPQHKTINA